MKNSFSNDVDDDGDDDFSEVADNSTDSSDFPFVKVRTKVPLFAGTTIEEAKEWIEAHLLAGVTCPCCEQHAQKYKRSLTATMVKILSVMCDYFTQNPHERWVHVPELLRQTKTAGASNAAALKKWGLIERYKEKQVIGKTKQTVSYDGCYFVTDKGYHFITGQISIPRYFLEYNRTFDGLEGEEITVEEARLIKGKRAKPTVEAVEASQEETDE